MAHQELVLFSAFIASVLVCLFYQVRLLFVWQEDPEAPLGQRDQQKCTFQSYLHGHHPMRVKLKCGSYYEGVITKYFETSQRYFYKLLFSGNMGNFIQVHFQGSIQGIWYHNLRSHSDGTRMINERQRKRKEGREGGKEDNNSKQALKFRNENSFHLIHLDFRPQGKTFP